MLNPEEGEGNMTEETPDPIREADKPFILAVGVVSAWIASIAAAIFVFRDMESAKFFASTFGPAAGMGLMFYLRQKEE